MKTWDRIGWTVFIGLFIAGLLAAGWITAAYAEVPLIELVWPASLALIVPEYWLASALVTSASRKRYSSAVRPGHRYRRTYRAKSFRS